MRHLLLAILLLLAVVPVRAHDPASDACPDAQAWYDTMRSIGERAAESWVVASRANERLSVRFRHLQAFDAAVDAVADADTPACVALARMYYYEGMVRLAEYLRSDLDGTPDTTRVLSGLMAIGEYRGYLQALGVSVAPRHAGEVALF